MDVGNQVAEDGHDDDALCVNSQRQPQPPNQLPPPPPLPPTCRSNGQLASQGSLTMAVVLDIVDVGDQVAEDEHGDDALYVNSQ